MLAVLCTRIKFDDIEKSLRRNLQFIEKNDRFLNNDKMLAVLEW